MPEEKLLATIQMMQRHIARLEVYVCVKPFPSSDTVRRKNVPSARTETVTFSLAYLAAFDSRFSYTRIITDRSRLRPGRFIHLNITSLLLEIYNINI